MSPHIRKLIGGAGMVAFVLVYALVAMALVDSRPVQEANEILRTLIYVALGLVWVLPMMPLVVWMETGKLRKTSIRRDPPGAIP